MRVVNQITFEAKDDAEALRLAAERLGKDAVILSTRMVKEGGFMGLFQRPVLKVTAGILMDDEPKKEPKPKPKDQQRSDEDTRRETVMAFQKFMELKERSSNNTLNAANNSAQNNITAPATGEEGYRPIGSSQDGDVIHVSTEGLRSAYGLPSNSANSLNSLNSASPASIASPANNNLNPQNAFTPQNPASPVNLATPVNPATSAVSNQILNPSQTPEQLKITPQNQAQAQAQPVQSPEDSKILKQVGALSERIDSLLERLAVVGSEIASQRMRDADSDSGFQAGLPVSDAGLTPEERGFAKLLRDSEVDEKYIRKYLADYAVADFKDKDKNKKATFTEWLASLIKCSGDKGGDAAGGRKIMLLGPTGVGKTTTIAKLAAIKALWEHKKVLLLTSDTYRIAAVDQLKTYAKILGVPIETIFEPDSLPAVIEAHDNADIILLDTAGRAPRDRKSLEIFESIYNIFKPDAVHLVLAANMKYKDMLDVTQHIPSIPISHLIFTKLDETVSYGAVFNIQQVMGSPISFLAAGQNVPKDIETATGMRIAEFLMKSDGERRA